MVHRISIFVLACLLVGTSLQAGTISTNRKPSSTEKPECKTVCSVNQVCLNTFTDQGAHCSTMPQPAPLKLVLPFDAKTEVICTHSSGSGSHSGANAYFALDLATDYSLRAATVRAAADGIAYVINGEDGKLCPEPKGSPSHADASTCGESWGNRVKVLHKDGYFSFYVHLDHPLVKTGDMVRAGDPIGIEGWTGAAGHRHLHWSVQKLPGKNAKEWARQIVEYTGESVPFVFKAVQNGKVQDFDVTKIQCARAGIGEVSAAQQPRFRGVR